LIISNIRKGLFAAVEECAAALALAKNGALADGAIVRDHSSQKPTEVFARAAIVEGLSNIHLWPSSVGHHDHRLSWRPR
jgi:hypothetical protein